MLYFSYGSNMSLPRLVKRVPSAQVIGIARLHGHELRFHKKSNKDGSAKCDIYFTGDEAHIVRGVVFKIDPKHKGALDTAEGLGYGYEEKTVELVTEGGDTIVAFTYYATLIDANLQPYHWYKEHVVRGAMGSGLPEDYIAILEQVVSVDDPDHERHEREMAIYR